MPHHLAARAGYEEGLELLLRSGADVNALTLEGLTALQLADLNGKSECAALLRGKEQVQAISKEAE